MTKFKTSEDSLREQVNRSQKAIMSACEKVGKDSDGKFPVNAYELAERILKLEKENKLLKDRNFMVENFWKLNVENEALKKKNLIKEMYP